MGAALDAGTLVVAPSGPPVKLELPLPAAEVMGLALYHPESGYYRRLEGPWGFEGKDYYTALDLGPLLGQALAVRLEEAWELLDRPGIFTVLEPGAGRGWLGRDILGAASPPFAEALRYVYRDDSPGGRREAESVLAPFLAKGQVRLTRESDLLEPLTGAVISNELFDALPAQPWRWDGQQWLREELAEEGPRWQPADPGEAGAWFARQAPGGLQPGDGSVWCEELSTHVASLAGALEAGLFLAIDYGDSADRLLGKGADIRRFQAHGVDGRWWEDLGTADLTADVDFTRLGSLLDAAGCRQVGHQTLSRWIRAHAPLAAWELEWQELEPVDRVKRLENLLQLTLPGMMGERFRVAEGWKGESRERG